MRRIGVTLARVLKPPSVSVVVTDSSPQGPVKRDTRPGSVRGRGLQIAEALCVYWSWYYEGSGKIVPRDTRPESMTSMTDVSDVPMLHDIDADYTPQCVKLASVLRSKIESVPYHLVLILCAGSSPTPASGSSRAGWCTCASSCAARPGPARASLRPRCSRSPATGRL
jgi:hypothetical protein